MFSVVEVDDEQVWETAVAGLPQANFLQSFAWGMFQQQLGRRVWRLAVTNSKQQQDLPILGICQVVKETAKRGAYLSVAGGPVLMNGIDEQAYQVIFAHLSNLAKQERADFVRVRPQLLDTPAVRQLFAGAGFKLAPMHLTADLTLQLDLTQTSEQLLAGMRKSTRYEIKRADKLGIKVEFSSSANDIQEFYEQQLALAKKQKFVPFSYKFLHEQFKAFAQQNQVLLIKSTLDDHWLASAFVIFYGQEAVYHYGISTPANQKLPGSYACQWAAIQEAKERGMQRYNFWGIAPENQPNHRFAGVSLFKRGFGGTEVAYLPAQDLPTSWKYPFIASFETWRRKLRRL